MPTPISKSDLINHIRRFTFSVRRWKPNGLMRRAGGCFFPSWNQRRTPPGCVAVYVGPDRHRFVVPVRFLNFPVFVALLDQAEQEFGFPITSAIVLPCDPVFFRHVLETLEEMEDKFAGYGLDEFRAWVRLVAFVESIGRSDSSEESSFPPAMESRNGVAAMKDWKVV